MLITNTQPVNFDRYACEVCKKRRGIGVNHYKCSKILQEKYRNATPAPKPVHSGIIKAYKSLYERF